MKTGMAIALVGVILIIVGSGLAYYGFANPMKTQAGSSSASQVLIPRDSFILQATQPPWIHSAQLQKGQSVSGVFGLTNFTSSQGPVFFYIQNETQLVNWGKCSPCAWPTILNQTAPSSGIYKFTWAAPASGAYYFTVDPEFYNATLPAYFDANTTTTIPGTTATIANTSLIYGGVGLAIIGAILAGAGLVLASSSPSKPQKTVTPRPSGSRPSNAESGTR